MLPLLLTIKNDFKALIVGGGKVAFRRARWLRDSGIMSIELIAPEFSPELQAFDPTPVFHGEPYTSRDLSSYNLILACTNDEKVNSKVEHDARRYKVLCNRADSPDSSDFHVPAVIHRGNVTIAVNTGTPVFTRHLKAAIEDVIPQDTAVLSSKLNRIRNTLLTSNLTSTKTREILQHFSEEKNKPYILAFPLECTDCQASILELFTQIYTDSANS